MGCFLATVWEGKRKKEEREGPGHSCSDGSPENRLFLLPPWQRKYQRKGAAKHIPLEGLYPSSLVPHLPVLPIDSPEAEVGGWEETAQVGFHGKERRGAGDEMTPRRARSFKNWG